MATTTAAKPCILQINSKGAWTTVLPFDASDTPEEGLEYFDKFLRLMADKTTTARVVMGKPGSTGRTVATHMVLMRWTRTEGWVNT